MASFGFFAPTLFPTKIPQEAYNPKTNMKVRRPIVLIIVCAAVVYVPK